MAAEATRMLRTRSSASGLPLRRDLADIPDDRPAGVDIGRADEKQRPLAFSAAIACSISGVT